VKSGKPKNPSSRPVVLLTGEFPPRHGGIATYALETARALAAAGHPVTVGAPRSELNRLPDDLPFARWPLPISYRRDWVNQGRLWWALKKATSRWQHATVILAEPLPLLVFMAWCWPLPAPAELIPIFHGSELQRMLANAHLRQRLGGLLQQATRVGVVSSFVGEKILAAFPEVAEKVVRVPGAVAPPLLPPVVPTRDPSSATAEEPLRLLCVGRLHPRKGQDLLLRALALLPAEVQVRFAVHLVGPARKPAFARQLKAAAKFLTCRVTFATEGLGDDALAETYRASDVLIFPSRPSGHSIEGLGLSLLEAQTWGLPVIAARTGGTVEAFAEGETGLGVSPDDPSALAQALQTLLDDPSLRKRLAAAGPAWVSAHFSWEQNAVLLLDCAGEV